MSQPQSMWGAFKFPKLPPIGNKTLGVTVIAISIVAVLVSGMLLMRRANIDIEQSAEIMKKSMPVVPQPVRVEPISKQDMLIRETLALVRENGVRLEQYMEEVKKYKEIQDAKLEALSKKLDVQTKEEPQQTRKRSR